MNGFWEIVDVNKKSRGPKTLPCGTPERTGNLVEHELRIHV